MRAPKYDLYIVSGGYLPRGSRVLMQEFLGDTPELEPGQTAYKVTGGFDPELSIELLTGPFDDIAEGDNYHFLRGVGGNLC